MALRFATFNILDGHVIGSNIKECKKWTYKFKQYDEDNYYRYKDVLAIIHANDFDIVFLQEVSPHMNLISDVIRNKYHIIESHTLRILLNIKHFNRPSATQMGRLFDVNRIREITPSIRWQWTLDRQLLVLVPNPITAGYLLLINLHLPSPLNIKNPTGDMRYHIINMVCLAINNVRKQIKEPVYIIVAGDMNRYNDVNIFNDYMRISTSWKNEINSLRQLTKNIGKTSFKLGNCGDNQFKLNPHLSSIDHIYISKNNFKAEKSIAYSKFNNIKKLVPGDNLFGKPYCDDSTCDIYKNCRNCWPSDHALLYCKLKPIISEGFSKFKTRFFNTFKKKSENDCEQIKKEIVDKYDKQRSDLRAIAKQFNREGYRQAYEKLETNEKQEKISKCASIENEYLNMAQRAFRKIIQQSMTGKLPPSFQKGKPISPRRRPYLPLPPAGVLREIPSPGVLIKLGTNRWRELLRQFPPSKVKNYFVTNFDRFAYRIKDFLTYLPPNVQHYVINNIDYNTRNKFLDFLKDIANSLEFNKYLNLLNQKNRYEFEEQRRHHWGGTILNNLSGGAPYNQGDGWAILPNERLPLKPPQGLQQWVFKNSRNIIGMHIKLVPFEQYMKGNYPKLQKIMLAPLLPPKKLPPIPLESPILPLGEEFPLEEEFPFEEEFPLDEEFLLGEDLLGEEFPLLEEDLLLGEDLLGEEFPLLEEDLLLGEELPPIPLESPIFPLGEEFPLEEELPPIPPISPIQRYYPRKPTIVPKKKPTYTGYIPTTPEYQML